MPEQLIVCEFGLLMGGFSGKHCGELLGLISVCFGFHGLGLLLGLIGLTLARACLDLFNEWHRHSTHKTVLGQLVVSPGKWLLGLFWTSSWGLFLVPLWGALFGGSWKCLEFFNKSQV